MHQVWQKHSQEEIKRKVFEALDKNVNYVEEEVLGLPASFLDEKVFHQDAGFLDDAPFLSTMLKNPNHIGCHTLGESEHFFQGTQAIEKEAIDICALDILKGQMDQCDGYIASGGTEANIQAIWIYRNYFLRQKNASLDQIAILCSSDSHYSMDKAGNLLHIDIFKVPVVEENRSLETENIIAVLNDAIKEGKSFFIVVANMMTTMFGSVDDPNQYVEALKSKGLEFKLHIDGAYGGFYFPFANNDHNLSFANPYVSSVTLDAHKMAQAPYGTGIFLIRKGWMQYANTKEASYVEGQDYTLSGSRSGANAIAVWMILVKHGPFGWKEKIFILQKRTDWFCKEMDQLGLEYFRDPHSNIITLKADIIPAELASSFGLVPDKHDHPQWYKIVVMEHVTIEKLIPLVDALKKLLKRVSA